MYRLFALTLLLAFGVADVPLLADPSTTADPGTAGHIGIRLLDAPPRRHDPRASRYIVDHVSPGTTIHRRIQIENASDQIQHIEIYSSAATIQNGIFNPGIDRNPNELSSWVSVDHNALVLDPRSAAPVVASIAVPGAASRGERYAVIWAEVAAKPDASGNIGIINRVGIRVYLDVGPGGEPPSDFTIDKLTPGRTPDGQPEVVAHVHNTGERALDMNGTLSLSDGPLSMSAGPFAVELGTTLNPGDNVPVTVLLDKRLPNGPWQARLTLGSGLVERTVTATLTFPSAAASIGASVGPDSGSLFSLLPLIAALVVASTGLFLLGMRRGWWRLP